MPTTFLTHVHNGVVSLASTRHLVLDEADSLFDAGWGTECREIIQTVSKISADKPHQVIIVSATLPRSVNSVLDELLPGTQRITTPGMHRALPNLRQSFIDLKRFNNNRQLALLEVLRRNTRDNKTMVFCNTRSSAEVLHTFLASKAISALAMYQDAPGGREEAMRAFAADDGEERSRLMVCTDVASRGVDTTWVDHVILYDFPMNVIDYLHRVGRTARAGKGGKATGLVGRRDRMLAMRIQKSTRSGTVLS